MERGEEGRWGREGGEGGTATREIMAVSVSHHSPHKG